MSVIVRKQKPTSPGRRAYVKVVDTQLHKGKPHAPLLAAKDISGGRNNNGRITAWHRGGGHKRHYRVIDWKRNKDGVPGKVERIEYDPNRSANIALVLYADGERRYIIAADGLTAGSMVQSGADAPVAVGNCMEFNNIPLGTMVHCVEMYPGKGAQLARSAGVSVQFLARESGYATLRLNSGEMRKVPAACRAVIGEVGMSQHNLIKIGKAGRNRWKNKRPHVRGVAMNPVDHPHGGGEGRSAAAGGPRTPWGAREGIKTRRKKANSWKLIIRRRKDKSEK